MDTNNHNTNADNQNPNGDDHTPDELAAANVTAYALGQLHADERSEFERRHDASNNDIAAQEIRTIESIAAAISASRRAEPATPPSGDLKAKIIDRLDNKPTPVELPKRSRRLPIVELLVTGGVALVLLALLMPASQFSSKLALRINAVGDPDDVIALKEDLKSIPTSGSQAGYAEINETVPMPAAPVADSSQAAGQPANGLYQSMKSIHDQIPPGSLQARRSRAANSQLRQVPNMYGDLAGPTELVIPHGTEGNAPPTTATAEQERLNDALAMRSAPSTQPRSPVPPPAGANVYRGYIESQVADEMRRTANKESASRAKKGIDGLPGGAPPDGMNGGYGALPPKGGDFDPLFPESVNLGFPVDTASADSARAESAKQKSEFNRQKREGVLEKATATLVDQNKQTAAEAVRVLERADNHRNTEQYAPIYENQFLSPLNQPLSTFSIDVDTASYANARRFLTSGRLPPRNAVRIEELVNYFRYDYPQPKDDQPFSVNMEVAECPWKDGHLVLRVGLKGKDIERAKRPASNLVFLLDVSGSMSDENKLPLLKTAMKLLVAELGENDRVSIVTYAGDAGLKLPSAHGNEQKKINAAIDSLSAGGSTNGSAGIELAYEQAISHFIKEGTNRVILCTDGDLNVGITSDEALVRLIKDKAQSGVFLTVLGFGEGNLKDAKMERLADNGNGLYAYIDSVREAKKVLVEQLTGSTITIAKDVKIQIEFNPIQIAAYRLLGYENRVLAAQDFNNDKKDAGEIGAGHTVTALYELVPVGTIQKQEPQQQPGVDALKYQQPGANLLPENREAGVNADAPGPGLVPAKDNDELTVAAKSGELLTLKLRYKQPDADTSQLLEFPLKDRGGSFHSASPDFQFAAAVASFGMILRQSQYRGSSNLAAVEEIASGAIGMDLGGYRAEFIDLVRKAQALGAK